MITSGCGGKKKFERIIVHFNFSLGLLFWLVKLVTDSVKKRLINARFVDFLTTQVIAEQITLLNSLKEHIYNPLTDLQSAYKVVMVSYSESCASRPPALLCGALAHLSWEGGGGEERVTAAVIGFTLLQYSTKN